MQFWVDKVIHADIKLIDYVAFKGLEAGECEFRETEKENGLFKS